MTEQNNINQTGRVRPTIVAGNGDTAFVDYRDLHPRNEAAAVLGGAAAGAAGGGMLSAMPALIQAETETSRLGKLSFMGKGMIAIGVIVGAAIGGTVSWLNARTHNQWSQRVTAATLDKRNNQGPSV